MIGDVPAQDLDVRLKSLINTAPCMLFMKGTPSEPKCGMSWAQRNEGELDISKCSTHILGFSRQTIAILQELNAEFSTFNILMDNEVRQGTVEAINTVVSDHVACRSEDLFQLAHVPSTLCQGRADWGSGHNQGWIVCCKGLQSCIPSVFVGNEGEWRVGIYVT